MISVEFVKDENKVIAYKDKIIIGECQFTESNNTWNIIHTIVDKKYRNLGIARKMVECIIENSKKYDRNIKIQADCSYARNIIGK